MKLIRKRLTYANVMSSIAVFLVVAGGTAFAANQLAKNSVGANQIKKNAVTTAKIKKEAVAGGKIKKEAVAAAKIKNGAVGADKIADGAVTGSKIAGSAVTADKLVEAERSQAFQTWQEGLVNTETPVGLLGNYSTAAAVVTSTLNPGLYVVTASVEHFNSAIEPRSVVCRLFDDGVEIGEGSAALGEIILTPQGTATVTGISDGGQLNLRCRASGDDTFAWNRKITAIRVGSVG